MRTPQETNAEESSPPKSEASSNNFDYQGLDEIIHSRIRLAILSVLITVESAEFSFLKTQVNTTDGNLSVHLKKLEETGYVQSEKTFVNRKPNTRYRLTEDGRRAFSEYVERLARMVGSR